MGRLISSIVFCCALSLHAQPRRVTQVRPPALPDPTQQQHTVDRLKQFVGAFMEDLPNVTCVKQAIGILDPVPRKAVVVDLTEAPERQGTPSNIEVEHLLQEVFSVSSGTEFKWERWATLRGKRRVVYSYIQQSDGRERYGVIYADEESGAISRIVFPATNEASHFFCSPQRK